MIKLAKFGGSSLSQEAQFRKVKNIVTGDDTRTVVVVSALGKRVSSDNKITDLLYILHAHMQHDVEYDSLWQTIVDRFVGVRDSLHLSVPIEDELAKILHEVNEKRVTLDYLVSRGEYLTALLVSDYLNYTFVDAKDLITFQYNGKFDVEQIALKARSAYKKYGTIIVPGFYGAYPNGEIKLMSRGGSDITGSLLARALNADIYENWTDVSGILMADPRIVDNPEPITRITYRELRELSYMGANVLHEAAISPIQDVNIPLNIRNTNAPDDEGTLISSRDFPSAFPITGIAGKKDFTSLILYKSQMSDEVGFLSRTMQIFERHNISIEHVPTGIDNVGIVVESCALDKIMYNLLEELKNELHLDDVEVVNELALIAIVGWNMRGNVSLTGRVFMTLSELGINVSIISKSAQEINLIIGVKNADYDTAIKALYEELVNN